VLKDGRLLSSGGRVLSVTATDASFPGAAERSREATAAIRLEGGFHRADIGWRERQRRGGT
ncbi:MAG: phosphoribosylamine--glycine ligase, partial [Gemmatimonadetes bacterium]|nr:phosphoribosylamine--glycine ligase [Gemmatimonadota bacterium]